MHKWNAISISQKSVHLFLDWDVSPLHKRREWLVHDSIKETHRKLVTTTIDIPRGKRKKRKLKPFPFIKPLVGRKIDGIISVLRSKKRSGAGRTGSDRTILSPSLLYKALKNVLKINTQRHLSGVLVGRVFRNNRPVNHIFSQQNIIVLH